MYDLAKKDGMDLSQLISKGEISAAEVLETTIERIERLNPQLNAVVHAHFDLARKQVTNGVPKSPLSGVPMLLKNTGFESEGMILSSGSELLRNAVSKRDSTITARHCLAG